MKITVVLSLLVFDLSLSLYSVKDDTHMSLDAAPFSWGVASGDPTTSSVILWTRVKIEQPIKVLIATDKSMKNIVKRQETEKRSQSHPSKHNDYSVHMKINDLLPDTIYYYQFEANGEYSRIGRTKTAPSTPRTVRIGVISCSSHWNGWFNAYRGLLSKDIDFIIHMGDVVYNSLPSPEFEQRRVPLPLPSFIDPQKLEDWRKLHEYLRHDVDFRNLLANIPWIVQWDNHDVVHEGGEQAFFEWFPLEIPNESHYSNAHYRIDRQIQYGPLIDIFVVDTHLGHKDGGGKLIGSRQMNNLIESIPESTARYRILSSTKTIAPWKITRLPFKLFHKNAEIKDLTKGALHPRNWFNHFNFFKKKKKKKGEFHLWKSHDIYFDLGLWDGSPVERRKLLKVLKAKGNNIIVSGDTHTALAADVINANEVHKYQSCNKHAAAVEFAPSSVSRENWDAGLKKQLKLDPKSDVSWAVNYVRAVMAKANPHHAFVDLSQHGYGVLTVSPHKVQGDYFFVDKTVPMEEVEEENSATLVMKHNTKCWDRDLSTIPKYHRTISGALGGHIRHTAKKVGKWFKDKFSADMESEYDDYYDQYYYNEDMENEYDDFYSQLLDELYYDEYDQYDDDTDSYDDNLYYYYIPQWSQADVVKKKQ